MAVELPEAFRDLFKPAPFKGYYGGRGGAKTESFAAACLIEAARQPLNILCCREIQRSIKDSVKRTLDLKIAEVGLGSRYNSSATDITNDIGSRFLFSGLRDSATAIRSMARINLVWVEEANTVSQSSLDTLLPTIRTPWPDGRDPEFWFSWNPRHANDPVDAMLRGKVPPPGAVVKRVDYRDNKFFPESLDKMMRWDMARDPDRYAHIWLGEYASMSEARVFRNWTVGTMDVPASARPYYGADWGFSVDPTVLVRCYVLKEQGKLYVDACISRTNVQITATPAFFDTLDEGQARKWPMRADSARPETIVHMQTHGYPNIVGAKKGAGSVDEGVEFLKSFDIVVHPNCRPVIDEMTLYSYETDKLTNEVLPKLADKHNNTIDALRYAVEALRRAGDVGLVGPFIASSPRSYVGDHPGY